MILPWDEPVPGASKVPLALTGEWAAEEVDPHGAGRLVTWIGTATADEPLVAAVVVEVGERVGWTRSRFGPAPPKIGLAVRLFEPAPRWRQTWGAWVNVQVSQGPPDLGRQAVQMHVPLTPVRAGVKPDVVMPSSASTGVLTQWAVVKGRGIACRLGLLVLRKRDVRVARKHIWRPKPAVGLEDGPLAEILRGPTWGWMAEEEVGVGARS